MKRVGRFHEKEGDDEALWLRRKRRFFVAIHKQSIYCIPLNFISTIIKTTHIKKQVSIIGGGPAALFLACKLDPEKFKVTIYEKNNALARKFLVAGKGGFNLTHSENAKQFVEKYSPKDKLQHVFEQFDNSYFIHWLNSIGIETLIGSSKRVFPKKGTKPIEVLNAIEKELKKRNVEVKFGVEFNGWDGASASLSNHASAKFILSPVERLSNHASASLSNHASASLSNQASDGVYLEHSRKAHGQNRSLSEVETPGRGNDITIFALGGGSWKVTGSDGSWLKHFEEMGIDTVPFQASNCAFKVEWNSEILKKLDGKAIKNAVFSCGSKKIMGEAVITQFGMEGSGVYPLSGSIRESLAEIGKAYVHIDLKPDITEEVIFRYLKNKGDENIKDILISKIKLSDIAFQLIKLSTTKEEYHSPEFISQLIKKFPVTVTGLAPIDEAISTVGGIPFEELNSNFELKKLPNTYCIGEMVNWDAPTGGYLLQMCFSMGFYLGEYLNKK